MTATLLQDTTGLHRRIVEAAILAPSAENTQPWQFSSNGESLTFYLDRQRVLESDVDFMLDLTSLGACIENAVIAAREAGYEPTVNYEVDRERPEQDERLIPVAHLNCRAGGEQDALFPYITTRCTCRRMDGTRLVEKSVLDAISAHIGGLHGPRVDWVTDRRDIRRLAKLVGLGNRIRFEYAPFHKEFYNNIRFSREKVESTRDGLDVATLQLPWGVATILACLRKWPRMWAANLLGFSRGVARQAAAEVCASGAMGILTVEEPTRTNFLSGGREFERLWLSATAAGIGLHPAASLAVFLAYAERTDGHRLLAKHWRMAQAMKQEFDRLYPQIQGRTVQMVFRLGYAGTPRVRSLRRPAQDVLDLT